MKLCYHSEHMDINTFETLTACGALLLQLGTLIVAFLAMSRKTVLRRIVEKVEKKFFLITFVVILLSTIGSLLYSEYYAVPACKLCWFQRILLFPQLIVLLVAWLHREKRILAKNILAFSIPGFLLAIYQTLWQYQIASSAGISCGFEEAASCSQIHMLKFGFITFPVVSASVFLFLIVLSVLVLSKKRKTTE